MSDLVHVHATVLGLLGIVTVTTLWTKSDDDDTHVLAYPAMLLQEDNKWLKIVNFPFNKNYV